MVSPDSPKRHNTLPRFLPALLILGVGCSPSNSTDQGVPTDAAGPTPQGTDAGLMAAWDEHYSADQVVSYELVIDGTHWRAMLADPTCANQPPATDYCPIPGAPRDAGTCLAPDGGELAYLDGGTCVCGDQFVPATFKYHRSTAGGQVTEIYPRVGVHFKGTSSRVHVATKRPGERGYQRYSFKVKFDEYVDGQSLHGIKTLNLQNLYRDPAAMRERIAYDLFRQAGVPASRVGYAELVVNGMPYGVYASVQDVNKALLKQWFANASGNLYRSHYGDLTYQGNDISSYCLDVSTLGATMPQYELETNESGADYAPLLRLIWALNATPDSAFADELEQILDVPRFLRWLAVNTLLVALDSYAGNLAHNFYLYHDPTTGKFTYIPWDLNDSFGSYSCMGLYSSAQMLQLDIQVPYCLGAGTLPFGTMVTPLTRPAISRLLAVERFRAAYHAELRALLAGAFSPTAMSATISHWDTLLAGHLDNTADCAQCGFYSSAQYRTNLQCNVGNFFGLMAFTRDRGAYVEAMLECSGDAACAQLRDTGCGSARRDAGAHDRPGHDGPPRDSSGGRE